MKRIIYSCDRCGKEIKGQLYKLMTVTIDPDSGDELMSYEGAELCEDCYKAVDDAIAKIIKNEKPEPKKSREPAITDVGKLKALLRAGWKIKDIAIEFGCSEQTVRNTIKRLQDIDLGIEEVDA